MLTSRPDGAARRRLALLLGLLAGTGLRLGELAAARWGDLQTSLVDGEPVWLLRVNGRGGRVRRVLIEPGLKAALDQHQADLAAAGLVASASPAALSGGARPAAGAGLDGGSRPLIGILKRPSPRRALDARGLPCLVDPQADRGSPDGALGRSAIQHLLKRFFRDVAQEARLRQDAVAERAFAAASAQWLRHGFGRRAIGRLKPAVVQQLMGHADLRPASAYAALLATAEASADAQQLVREWRQGGLDRGLGSAG